VTAVAALLVAIGVAAAAHAALTSRRAQRSRQIDTWRVLSALAGAFAGFAVGASVGGTPATGVPLAVLGIGIPRAIRRRQQRERRRALREAWPDAIQGLIASVLAGRSLHLAMIDLADDGPEALQPFWSRYRRLSATLDQRRALEVLRDEVADPFVDRLTEVLIAALDIGPMLAIEILGDLAAAASEDLQFDAHQASANLEQKINSRVVAIVPTIALLLLVWSNQPARDFYASSAGLTVAVIGSLITGAGILVVDRLGQLAPEPRVFVRRGAAT
jgi:tight adherence protein B